MQTYPAETDRPAAPCGVVRTAPHDRARRDAPRRGRSFVRLAVGWGGEGAEVGSGAGVAFGDAGGDSVVVRIDRMESGSVEGGEDGGVDREVVVRLGGGSGASEESHLITFLDLNLNLSGR